MPASAAAARAQREAAVIGWVDGVAVGREVLDQRIRVLRSGTPAGRLPTVGSKEDRQFVRWTAQVLLTEEVCRVEARRLGVAAGGGARALGQTEALQLGSINAAAWTGCPEMAALFQAGVAAPGTPEGAGGFVAVAAAVVPPSRDWWRVQHARKADPAAVSAAPLVPLGWTTLDDLPAALASAIRGVPLGTRVGPVETALGWHVAVATELATRPDPAPSPSPDGAPLRVFALWLDRRRRSLLTAAEGFEHPGDPSQPDNTHRH